MEKINYVKSKFDQFLKDNNAYDAWYERYRLDNLMYSDEVPIENFIRYMLEKNDKGAINSIFYSGIEGTAMCTNEGDKFIEENKKCDILSNGVMVDLDEKWVNNWEKYIDYSKICG